MAKWGDVDFKQLKRLSEQLIRAQRYDIEGFCIATSKELAARLLGKVIRRTPVGVYAGESGKTGGTLRRGWTAKSQKEAEMSSASGGDMAVKSYVDALPISKNGNVYIVEIINTVEYGIYVEFGHRTVNGGWVNGQFFLTISEQELRSQIDVIIQKKMQKWLREVVNGK